MEKALFILLCLVFLLCACSFKGEAEKKEVLAEVNDCCLDIEEFEEQLVADLTMEGEYKATRKAKRILLERMIREELLMQQAVERELDRKEKFIKAIERYWKSTFIRDVMELKGNSFAKTIYVTDEEVQKRYSEMKKVRSHIPPLVEIQEKIIKEIAEEKKSRKLVEWIESLHRDARIHINEKFLYGE